jgi:hypothetical protein
MNRRQWIAIAWLAACGVTQAAQCTLDRARYAEERSGAVIEFQRRDVATHGITITGLFTLRLPNIETSYGGEIAWSAGRFARPIGSIAQPCTAEAAAEWPNACWLWTGQVYAIGDEAAGLIEDADMAAPQALLLAEFGRALLLSEAFGTANPDRYAFDVFILEGCAER